MAHGVRGGRDRVCLGLRRVELDPSGRHVPFVQPCEQASHNGDLVHAVEAGFLSRDDVTQLGHVLIGQADGRNSGKDITACDSTGLAIQDLAIAIAAMERAEELDLPQLHL